MYSCLSQLSPVNTSGMCFIILGHPVCCDIGEYLFPDCSVSRRNFNSRMHRGWRPLSAKRRPEQVQQSKLTRSPPLPGDC